MTRPSAPTSRPPSGVEQGRVVAGNLRLIGPLGRGGMGRVWRAEHLALGSEVAVKFLEPREVPGTNLVAQLRHEARAAAQIRSPYVVRVFDVGLSDKLPYIVMELLDGETLAELLEREGRRPTRECTLVVAQVAKALSAAHKLGIVHRDIKPDNVFLVETDDDEPPFVKVFDFGIAKLTRDPSPVPSNVVGTPHYMSPEQLRRPGQVDARADLWSLAVVAYEALTGVRPFDGRSLVELCMAVIHSRFPPPSRLRPDLPGTVDLWFERALHRDLERRFGSAKELANSFLQVMATVPDTLDDDAWDQWMSSARFFISVPRRRVSRPELKPMATLSTQPAPPPGDSEGDG